MEFGETIYGIIELSQCVRGPRRRFLPSLIGCTERSACRTRRLLWINKLGCFYHLTFVSLGTRLDGFHLGSQHRRSEFAIRSRVWIKVDAKHLQQFIDFPSKGGVVASRECLSCRLERPVHRPGTLLHFSVGQAELRRSAHLVFGFVLDATGAHLLGYALKELF